MNTQPDAAEYSDMARKLAGMYLQSDVETNCPVAIRSQDGAVWRDTRPMLDPREHCPQLLDINRAIINYGLAVGMLAAHPHTPHLVRVIAQ